MIDTLNSMLRKEGIDNYEKYKKCIVSNGKVMGVNGGGGCARESVRPAGRPRSH